MKIKIFNKSITELSALENEVNTFIAGKTGVELKQTAVNRGTHMEIVITVLYNK